MLHPRNMPGDGAVGFERRDRGAALVLTLLLMVALVAMTAGALVWTGTEHQLRTYAKAQTELRYAAAMGAEMGLSRVNRDEAALPDTGYNVLESGYVPVNADGDTIGGVRLNIYVARTGSATGRTGNFASIVGEAVGYGTRVVARLELTEESFAKYAYFSDNEGGMIWFGGGDQLFGPVHSNDEIKIHATGAIFHDDVSTASTIRHPENGTFLKGYEEGVELIPLPDQADFDRLEALAIAGNAFFAPGSTGNPDKVEMRVEFVSIDVNGDGDEIDEDEGFFRVYRSNDSDWVGAYDDGGGGGPWTYNCGDWHDHPNTGEPWFISARNHRELYEDAEDYEGPYEGEVQEWEDEAELRHGIGGSWSNVYRMSVDQADSRCFLGGDPRLTLTNREFDPWNGGGGDDGWLRRQDFAPTATLPAALAGRDDADFLFPIHRDYNPDFRGVLFFDGLVGVSGVLNGRVSVVSSDNVVLLDDFTYSVPANAERCNDIAGFLSARNFYVADNHLNAPRGFPGAPMGTYDETGSEFIDGIVLTLDKSFTVENYNQGPTNAQDCEAAPWGRGCIYLTGGLIQDTRGPVGLSNGRGYLKRYAYDSNARFCPPPHFPTTGSYAKNRYYEVNPDAFEDPGAFFGDLR